MRSVALFLDGRHDELSGELTARMKDASQQMAFELAAVYRDQLRAVETVREEQRVVTVKDVDQDVVGFYREGSLVEVLVILVRGGHVKDTLSFSLRGVELPDEEVLSGFLTQYYGEGAQAAALIPDEILLPLLPDGAAGVAEWLGELRGKKVALLVPQRGPRTELLAMANDNARTPSGRSSAAPTTSRPAWKSCAIGCACPACRGASSAATSRTWAAATPSARSWRCSTAPPTGSTTGAST